MKYKIFVSGVQKELKAERRAVKDSILNDVLLSEYFDVFLFEDSPAKSHSAEKAYLGEVRKSNIYIGIFGDKYCSTGKNKISPTEAEFRNFTIPFKDRRPKKAACISSDKYFISHSNVFCRLHSTGRFRNTGDAQAV